MYEVPTSTGRTTAEFVDEGKATTKLASGPMKSIVTADVLLLAALLLPSVSAHVTRIAFTAYTPSGKAKDEVELSRDVHVLPPLTEYLHDTASAGRDVTKTDCTRYVGVVEDG